MRSEKSVAGEVETNLESDLEEPKLKEPKKVTFIEAERFVRERGRDLGHSLIDKHMITQDDGSKLFMFLTESQEHYGYVCVQTVSEFKLEVIAVDCNTAGVKLPQWSQVKMIN